MIRRLLPALLALLLLLSTAAVTAAVDPGWREGFEGDLSAWTVQLTRPGSATIARDAAATGATGLAIRARGGAAIAGRALPSGTGVLRIAFDVRRDAPRGASVLTLLRAGRVVLRLRADADGSVFATDGTGARHGHLGTLPTGRFRRVVLRIDRAAGMTRLTIGTTASHFRTPGRAPAALRLGGAGSTRLSFDAVAAAVLTSPSPRPSPPVTPSPSPSPSPSPTPPVESRYRFTGKGSDHGAGMSQTGAIGRAKAGQRYPEILAHYYAGTIVETRPSIVARTIRVLVAEPTAAPAGRPLEVCGRHGTWTIEGSGVTFPTLSCARFVAGSPGTVVVSDPSGAELWHAQGTDWNVKPVAGATLLALPARAPRDQLRGSFHVVVGSTKAQVVNVVDVESYLRSVVPMEMSASRPGEALRAQAIAARTYALYHMRASDQLYDVHDDTRSQVYGGFSGESALSDAAVADTAGMVATYQGKIIDAVFHAEGGGATEDARNVFNPADGSQGTDVPYLRGSPDLDPDGVPYDKGGGYDSWRTGTFTMADLSGIMATDLRTDVGVIDRLVLTDRGISGRLISVTLIGQDGTRKKVAGWLFKSVFNAHHPTGRPLLSTLFERAAVR